MFIIRLIRYVLGFVELKASGGFSERFINLCARNNIPLWDIKKSQKCLYAKTTVGGYKRIRESAKRSGVTVRIENKKGLPFFTYKQKKRAGLVIGLFAVCIVISFLSTMIWTVSVTGNKEIPTEQITEVFSSLGVKMGVRRSSIDVAAVSDAAVKEFGGALSWATVNIDGSKASIEVRESIAVPQIEDNITPCNIVASEDGVITKIQLFSGQEEIKTGSAVLKGDLLISGVKINLDKSETLKHADGKVYAEIQKKVSSDFPDCEFFTVSREKIRYTLYFFGIKIPLGLLSDYGNCYRVESYLENGGTILPVGVIRDKTTEYLMPFEVTDEKQTELISAKKYFDSYREVTSGAKILSSEINKDGTRFTGVYKCEKQIGEKQEIFVEKN